MARQDETGSPEGRVEGIYLTGANGEPLAGVDRAGAVAGRGLEGDRYFSGKGEFSGGVRAGRALTLIEAEAIEALAAERGIQLASGESRRNLVTRGIGLNDLVGRRFRVGEVECYGDRLCDPCNYLEKHTLPGALKGLANRGGLRADILTDGEISVGDPVVALDPATNTTA